MNLELDLRQVEDFFASDRRRPNVFIGLSVGIACCSSLLLGYDISIMSAARLFIVKDFDLTTVEDSIIVASVNFAALIGSIGAGSISDCFGRKKTVFTSACLFLAGALLMALSVEFWSLLAGRVLTGVGVGTGLLIAPLFVAELAPPSYRGMLVAVTETSINVGILLGYIVGFLISYLKNKSLAWRLMLGFGGIPAILLGVGVLFLAESPRWLVKNRREQEAALSIARSSHDVQEVTQRLGALVEDREKHLQQQGPRVNIFRFVYESSKQLKRILWVGVMVAFLQQATGIEAAMYFTPTIFEQAGLKGDAALLGATIGIGVSKLAFTVLASLLLDRFGRRPFLVISSVGCLLSLSLLGASFSIPEDVAWLAITGQCLFVASFGLGWGPICWVYISEVFPTAVRGRFMGVATFVNRLTSAVVALVFLPLSEAISVAGMFYLFSGMGLLCLALVVLFVPETSNKTLEELSAHLGSRWLVVCTAQGDSREKTALLEEPAAPPPQTDFD